MQRSIAQPTTEACVKIAGEITTPFPDCDFRRETAEDSAFRAAQFAGATAGHAGRARRAFVTGYEQEMQ